MAKRSAENQDYYKLRGGEVGRRTFADEKAKLKKGSQSARTAVASTGEAAAEKPAVGAKGAGVETAKRGKKRQTTKSRKKEEEEVRHEVVGRMVQGRTPAAPPERQLPAAQRSTEVADFLRTTREDFDTLNRASRELVFSLADLARTPVRLLRLLRSVRASS